MISTDAIHVIVNGDMSGDILSPVIQLKNAMMACVLCTWDGASVGGQIDLLVSIDNVTYTTMTGVAQTIATDTDAGMFQLDTVPFPYMKVAYTPSGGTGLMQVSVSYKGDPAL